MVCETSGAQSPLQWSFLRNTQNLTSSAFLLLLRSRGHGVDALVSARACHMSRAFALERGAWSGAALDWPLAAAEAGGGAFLWRGVAAVSGAFSEAPRSAAAQGSVPWLVLQGCFLGTP